MTAYVLFLPPLRERKNDIPLLIQHFLNQFGHAYGKKDVTISEEALVALCSYDFPGNIRELQNILQQAIIKSSAGSSITSEDFPFSLSQSEFSFKSWKETRRQAILSWEKEYLSRVLTASSGHKSSAAQRLQLTRQMLYKLMKRHRML